MLCHLNILMVLLSICNANVIMLKTKVAFVEAYSAHTMYCDLTGDVSWYKSMPRYNDFKCDSMFLQHCMFNHINGYHRQNHFGQFYCINNTHIMNYELVLWKQPVCHQIYQLFKPAIKYCEFWSVGNWNHTCFYDDYSNGCECYFLRNKYTGSLFDVDLNSKSYNCFFDRK